MSPTRNDKSEFPTGSGDPGPMFPTDPGDPGPRIPTDPGDLKPTIPPYVPLDPEIFLPRFQVWVHGSSATISTTAGGLPVGWKVGLSESGVRVGPPGALRSREFPRILLPIPWPAAIPMASGFGLRRPTPEAITVLYETSAKSKIVSIGLYHHLVMFEGLVAGAGVNWTGYHARDIDEYNHTPLVLLEDTAKFGLVASLQCEFEPEDRSYIQIVSVGLEFKIL